MESKTKEDMINEINELKLEAESMQMEAYDSLDYLLQIEKINKGNSHTTKRKHELALILSSERGKIGFITQNIDFIEEELHYGSLADLSYELSTILILIDEDISMESNEYQKSIKKIKDIEGVIVYSDIKIDSYDKYQEEMAKSYEVEQSICSLTGQKKTLLKIINIINGVDEYELDLDSSISVLDNSFKETKNNPQHKFIYAKEDVSEIKEMNETFMADDPYDIDLDNIFEQVIQSISDIKDEKKERSKNKSEEIKKGKSKDDFNITINIDLSNLKDEAD